MTNDDMIAALKTYGVDNTGITKKSVKAKNSVIYGPRAPELETPPPSMNKNSKKPKGTGVYHEIFGPDYQDLPGKSTGDDSIFQFNPDLKKAFPTDGPPQPFLTDFSKFQQ